MDLEKSISYLWAASRLTIAEVHSRILMNTFHLYSEQLSSLCLSDLLKSQYCPTCVTICTPSGRQVDHIKKKKFSDKASGKWSLKCLTCNNCTIVSKKHGRKSSKQTKRIVTVSTLHKKKRCSLRRIVYNNQIISPHKEKKGSSLKSFLETI